MKKSLLITLVALFAVCATANGRDNYFTIGASADITVGNGAEYWGTNITGGYHIDLVKGLFLTPELSLFYHNFDSKLDFAMPGRGYENNHGVGVGVGINALAGYRLPSALPLDFYTGPVLDIAFTQYYTIDGHPGMGHDAAGLFWRFGLGIRVCRPVTVKAAFDLHVTNQYPDTNNLFNVGVAYNF